MQILITDSRLARNRVLRISPLQLSLAAAAAVLALVALAGVLYHLVFVKAAREGWPVVSQIVRFVVRDDLEQRDRFMRENLDAIAQKVGEMQAKLLKLESIGERVSDLAGVKPAELAPAASPPARGSRGGPYVPLAHPSLDELSRRIDEIDRAADRSADVFTLAESRLFEARLAKLLVPSRTPVDGAPGSGFGFRTDPFTGQPALHTGLDFPADVGTPIYAAAGGVVVGADSHPAYGELVEIDHGNGLVTRYAHASTIVVRAGDVVRKGQKVAEVGSTGRSTGPHLHFEVLVEGVPQDPMRFLAGAAAPVRAAAPRRRAQGG